jgi:uracil phosphoribosyltransferase
MRVEVVTHALLAHKLTLLRDERTASPQFRELVGEIAAMLGQEATRDLDLATGPRPLLVPILRAGLGMLEPVLRLLPSAEVGFLGMRRDESTHIASTYMERFPPDISSRHAIVLDPMLATGGSMVDAIGYLVGRGVARITCVCIVAAPEGVEAVRNAVRAQWPEHEESVRLVLGVIDLGLNAQGRIVPGLGDAGDRLYGVA